MRRLVGFGHFVKSPPLRTRSVRRAAAAARGSLTRNEPRVKLDLPSALVSATVLVVVSSSEPTGTWAPPRRVAKSVFPGSRTKVVPVPSWMFTATLGFGGGRGALPPIVGG